LNIGVYLPEQLIPGSSAVTPIAGTLIARGYSRKEEYAADRRGLEILREAGYSPNTLFNALSWGGAPIGRRGRSFLCTTR
jgi:Zn-dependent protease with chaperone function